MKLPSNLQQRYDQVVAKYPAISTDTFLRALLIYEGVNIDERTSFPDPFCYSELSFHLPHYFTVPVMAFMKPGAPFSILKTGPEAVNLLYQGKFVDQVEAFEERYYDLKKKTEPFYFFVYNPNGDLVLKLNPIQLCDFFQNSRGEMPCFFCFRNDMVQRFRNIKADDLIQQIIDTETAHDNLTTLKHVQEISIITGSYLNNDEYADEMVKLIGGLKRKLKRPDLRAVIGSHEGTGKEMYHRLKEAGVTHFTFAVESLDDSSRAQRMPNRKGRVPISEVLRDIESAVEVFGEDGVIVRLVAGLGDPLDTDFETKIKRIRSLGSRGQGPWWDVNIFIPFTHYHWRLFDKERPYTLDYVFEYYNIINRHVTPERKIRFKASA